MKVTEERRIKKLIGRKTVQKVMERFRSELPKRVDATAQHLQGLIAEKKLDEFVPKKVDPFLEAAALKHTDRVSYVLDVGCGYVSKVGATFSDDRPIQLVGVDILGNAYLQILQGMRLPIAHVIVNLAPEEMGAVFPPECFDLVVCYALDSFAHPAQAVSEMIRALKPGASAVIYMNPKTEGLGHYWTPSVRDGMLMLTDAEGTNAVISRFYGVDVAATVLEDGTIRAVGRKSTVQGLVIT